MSNRNILYYLFAPVRVLLYPLSLIYGSVVWGRNRLYDSGFYSSVEFSVPVICVGNLSVGGTGKTPHVEYLIRLFQYRYNTATMSRGYKRRTQGFLLAGPDTNALRIGDEPMQYFLKFPELMVSVAEERMTGIPKLLQQRPSTEVVLLDDAFQHRSVKAGMNILISDYARPFYDDKILPLGTLRESKDAYKRADVIIVSKCPDDMKVEEANEMRRQIQPLEHQHVYFTKLNYQQPYNLFTNDKSDISGKNIIMVSGIAKPEVMLNYLREKAKDVHVLKYADHHYYVSKDLEEIKEAYENWQVSDKVIVTTEKDAARLHLHADKLREWNIPICVLPVEVSFLFNGGHDFDSFVNRYVEESIRENNLMLYGEEEEKKEY